MDGDILGTTQSFPSLQAPSSPDSRSCVPPTRQGNQEIQCVGIAWELYRTSHPSMRQAAQISSFLFHQQNQEISRSRKPEEQLVIFFQVKYALHPILYSSTWGSPASSTDLLILAEAEQPRLQVFTSTTVTRNQQIQCVGIAWELHRTSHLSRSQAAQIPSLLFHQ